MRDDFRTEVRMTQSRFISVYHAHIAESLQHYTLSEFANPGPSSSQKMKRVSKTVMMYGCKDAPPTGETVETMERCDRVLGLW